jgi:fructokinase
MSGKYSLGIDIGGTKIEASIIGFSSQKTLTHPINIDEQNIHSFEVITRERIPTQRDNGYQDVLTRLQALINSVIEKSKISPNNITTIGIGLPGSVHPTKQTMIHGNSQIFEKEDIKKDLQSFLKEDMDVSPIIVINNDANCFALAESLGGAGLKFKTDYDVPFKDQTSIGIILGTGCGGGVLINGRLLNGKVGGGGEIGHTVLHRDGRDCYCKRKGCAELYLSGTGLEISFNLKNTSMSEDKIKALEIFNLLEKTGDKVAKATIDAYCEDLLLFICNLSNIFDPHYFVLGGGLSNQEIIYKNLEEKLTKINFLKAYSPKIYKNQLGDSAGVLGAALLPYL